MDKDGGKQASYIGAYDYLKAGIINGTFSSDYVFVETDIAEQLQISRTPVREAIRMLKAEKLLISVPKKGIVVRPISQSDVQAVYELAEVIEGMMAYTIAKSKAKTVYKALETAVEQMEQACETMDYDAWVEGDTSFHNALYLGSKNKFATEAMDNLQTYITLIRIRFTKSRIIAIKSSTTQHREAFEAMAVGDAEHARSTVQFHWRCVRRSLKDMMECDKQ